MDTKIKLVVQSIHQSPNLDSHVPSSNPSRNYPNERSSKITVQRGISIYASMKSNRNFSIQSCMFVMIQIQFSSQLYFSFKFDIVYYFSPKVQYLYGQVKLIHNPGYIIRHEDVYIIYICISPQPTAFAISLAHYHICFNSKVTLVLT